MFRLRKNKKEICKFETLFDLAENEEILEKCFGAENVEIASKTIAQNAFAMCITGAKMRIGGYIIEPAD